MATQKTEAIITLNGKQPMQVLNNLHDAAAKIKDEMEATQDKIKNWEGPKNTEPYKALLTHLKECKTQYDLLSTAQVKDIEASERLQTAVNNLANTSLKNLRKALGDGKRQIEGLSEAELGQANALREMMRTVGDQVRILEGQYVKIREGLADLSNQSNQWLSKAIRQQQEKIDVTRRGTSEYKNELQLMQQLQAEQERRNAGIRAETDAKRQAQQQAQFKQQLASSRQILSSTNTMKGYSQTEIQTAINTLKQAQGQANMGGSEWKQLGDEIAQAEENLAKLAGKVKEVKQAMSEERARSTITFMDKNTESEVREAINTLRLLQSQVNVGGEEWKRYAQDIEDAERRLASLTGKVKEAQSGLTRGDVSERLLDINAQSEQSLKEMLSWLEKMKASLAPYTEEWKRVADEIETVKARTAEVQANTRYAHTYNNAQIIARNNTIDFGEQAPPHDVTKQDLEWSRNYLQKQLDVTPIADTSKIKEIQEALGLIDERLKALKGNTEQATMSTQKLNEILDNMKTASLDDLKAASAELNKQLGKLAPSSDGAKQVKQQLQALDKEIKQVEDDVVDVNDVIARSKNKKASIDELKKAYQQLQVELNKIETGDKDFKDKQKALKELKKEIDNVTGAANKQGGAWQTAAKNLTAYVGLFSVFNKIKDTVTAAIKKNFDYSSSLTDIRKVSGLTMQDVNKLSNELAKIDTRTSVDGLAQLAYQGAKLGMGKYGIVGMKQFVAAADQINVAIGEEMGEEALPALSKMVETMGLIPKMGIEKAMLATGSAMFKLSSTSTATSGNIVEFAKRLTGVSRTAGITTDQLLALGSASDSLFLMPEVSATAMSKFIVALQKNHNLIEKDLGIQQGTIKQMYAAGNAMDAIVMVLEKMRDKGNMNALGSIFKDLGSDGQRLVTAMVTMSKNVDVLKDHLYESKEAFEEASAVTNEYKMQQESAAGILDRANNLWEKAFVNPEGVNNVKSLAEAWYEMSSWMTQSPLFKGTLNAALQTLIVSAKIFVGLLPAIVNFAVSRGLWSLLTFFGSLAKGIWEAVTAQRALNTAMKANIFGAIASIVLTVAGAIWSYVTATEEAAKAEEEARQKANAWKDKLKEAQSQTDTLTRKLHSYKVTLEALNVSQAERNTQIARFNRDFRQYISKLGIEIKNVSDLKKHYSELAQEIQRATYYRLREEAKQNVMPSYQMDRLNAANRIKKALNSLGLFAGGFTQKNVMDMFNRGAGAGWIWQKIIEAGETGAKEGSFRFNTKNGVYSYITNDKNHQIGGQRITVKAGSGKLELLSSLIHYQNATKRETAKDKEINDYFNQVVNLDGYTPWVEDEPGTLENDAPDKDAIRAQKQEERERLKSMREELKQKQDEAKAIMDDVRNFYERQINAKLADAVSIGMDKTEQDLFVEPVKKRMEEALTQVRLAIAGQKNVWEKFKKTMDKDLVEKTDATGINLSKNLLNGITANNVDALRAKMETLGKGLNRSMGSITAEIFAKATQNEQNRIKLEAQQLETRRKVAQENDYMGAVKQNMYDDFNTMGYANPTNAEAIDKKAFDKRKSNIIAMYEKARQEIVKLYQVDVSNKAGQNLLMQMLFGNDPDGMALRIQSVLGDNAADWQVFYHKLIQYSDEYTEAQKKTYDQQKKISDQMWATNKRNLANQEKLRKMQNEINLFGKRTNFLSNLGLADLTADPEVELMRLRLQAAEDYYAFIEKTSKDKRLLQDADKSRMEAELNYANQVAASMKNRLSQMKELVQPIEDFGAAVGSAFAEMRNDVSGAQEAIKNALKSMLESWGNMALNDVNTQMWKAINDAGAKRGKKNAQPTIDAARADAEANANTYINADWRNLGTADNPMWVRLVGNEYVDMNGNSLADGEPPRAWKKRNPDGTIKDYNKEAFGIDTPSKKPSNNSSPSNNAGAFTGAANATGTAIADAATGGGSLSDAVAGIGGSIIGGVMNMGFNTGGGKKGKDGTDTDTEQKKQLKKEKKHQQELTKEVKKGAKDRSKETSKGMKDIVQTTEDGNNEQTKGSQIANQAMLKGTDALMNQTFVLKQQGNQEQAQADADLAETQMTFSIAGAIGKCFQFLGPIAGPIAAAVVMSTLTGLMQWALNSAFGSKKKSSTSSTNTKLVTGMLTYDSGNVQDLKPFVADNGEVYWAKEDDAPKQGGVQMLSQPTATTINGQPSLVAEKGPEIVIGRETTHAMMMNNPQLLKALVNYDSNYSGRNSARRAFDNGNVADTLAASLQASNGNLSPDASAAGDLLASSAASNAALLQAVNALLERLSQPISAKIDMYGRGNLYDSMTKANQFMKGKS